MLRYKPKEKPWTSKRYPIVFTTGDDDEYRAKDAAILKDVFDTALAFASQIEF